MFKKILEIVEYNPNVIYWDYKDNPRRKKVVYLKGIKLFSFLYKVELNKLE